MRVAYFDCFAGISGSMALGALVHAGADLDGIAETLGGVLQLDVPLRRHFVEEHGVTATRIDFHQGSQAVIRTYANIRSMLDAADLPVDVRRTAHRIFLRLAEAEAKVHRKDMDFVTFQELGELDCLIDIVGSAIALGHLGVERVFASPVPTGLGLTRTEHGLMPVPSPVVMELLQGAPTYSRGVPAELVTPTGAAILAALAEGYGEMPEMRPEQVGYGAGHLRLDFPNVLRVVVGQHQPAGIMAGTTDAEWLRLEALWPGLEPVGYEAALDEVLAAGAADAWVVPVVVRGGKECALIGAVAPAERRDAVLSVVRARAGSGAVRVTPVQVAPGED